MHHIVIFTLGNPANIGGVQLSTQRLVDHLCSVGHSVTLFSHFKCPKEDWAYPCKSDAVKYKTYSQKDTAQNRRDIRTALEELKPDIIVIINSSQTAGVVVSASSGLGIPLILSERGAPPTLIRHNWACRAQRDLVHNMCHASHVLMESYKEDFPPFVQSQTFVIPSAVPLADADEIPAFDTRSKRVLWVGRMTFEKDVNLLIDAFAQIAENHKDWKLILVGDGAMRAELEETTRGYKLEDQVIFMGSRFNKDLDDEYCKASIFALPSRSEGCPLALREAMGWKLPVIGYADCPGTNEIIKTAKNGLLVKTDTDRVTPFAQALTTLIEDEDLRRHYGEEARETAKEYRLDITHKKWEDMILACIGNNVSETPPAGSYAKHIDKMTQRLKKDGRSRNFITPVSSRDHRAFLKGKVRRLYFQLYGLPVFDFKEFFEQNPALKLEGLDPLLAYLTLPEVIYRPSKLSGDGTKAYSPDELLDYWKQGDFSGLDSKILNVWKNQREKDIGYNVFQKPGPIMFLRFLNSKTIWDRRDIWKCCV